MKQWRVMTLAMGGVFSSTVSLAQDAPIKVDIAAMQFGGEPADFTFWRTGQGEAGKWTVIADPTAANGRAIAQISKDRTDYRFPLAAYKPYSGRDLDISVRFKPVAGALGEAGRGLRGRWPRPPVSSL